MHTNTLTTNACHALDLMLEHSKPEQSEQSTSKGSTPTQPPAQPARLVAAVRAPGPNRRGGLMNGAQRDAACQTDVNPRHRPNNPGAASAAVRHCTACRASGCGSCTPQTHSTDAHIPTPSAGKEHSTIRRKTLPPPAHSTSTAAQSVRRYVHNNNMQLAHQQQLPEHMPHSWKLDALPQLRLCPCPPRTACWLLE